MNQQTSCWPTGLQRSLQSPDSPAGFQGITEIPTDNLSAEEIQKDHQVAPLSSHLEIGQVTDPNLVWSLRSKAAIQLVANDPVSWFRSLLLGSYLQKGNLKQVLLRLPREAPSWQKTPQPCSW